MIKTRSSVYNIWIKYCSINKDRKRACIPQLIWNDGHAEWSRWYWMKDKHEHSGRNKYYF